MKRATKYNATWHAKLVADADESYSRRVTYNTYSLSESDDSSPSAIEYPETT